MIKDNETNLNMPTQETLKNFNVELQSINDAMSEIPVVAKQAESYRSFYMKKTTWQAICFSRGWNGRGSVSKFAESINITRQYASGIVNGSLGCSSNVMRKIIDLLGIKRDCWCHLFDRYNWNGVDSNHPIFNALKLSGEVPYEPLSESAAFRSLDYPAETRKY